MIPSVKIDDSDEKNWWLGIPILNTSEFCWLEFGEDECFADVTKRFVNASPYGIPYCSLRSNICFDEAWDGDEGIKQILNVYEVECMKSKVQYFMVASDEYAHEDWDSMQHCVCIPYNKLNLFKFYKDYLMTFPDVRE